MNNFPIKVIAIPTEFAVAVRITGKSPGYGHPAHRQLATGYGPCRQCLTPFAVGAEDRIVFTYDAFYGSTLVPLPGPIFIHAETCERYPEDGGYPESLRQFPSVISAFGVGQHLLAQVHVDDGEQPVAVQRLLENSAVQYLHIRDKKAGCFGFRVERAEAQ
jgi:Protein of unknown function (DUF1203)